MTNLNVPNRTLYHGDNLNFLRGINSECIDLIATDPPFNKGQDFHANTTSSAAGAQFQDKWTWADIPKECVDQIAKDHPAIQKLMEFVECIHSESLAAFLCFMAVRLIECRRILKPTGSIYLHCDPTASHYLKALLDVVFGKNMFRNEIIWKRFTGSKNSATAQFPRAHDTLLFYTKHSGTNIINFKDINLPLSEKYIKASYIHTDDRGVYSEHQLTAPGLNKNDKEWRGYHPKTAGRSWAIPLTGAYAQYI